MWVVALGLSIGWQQHCWASGIAPRYRIDAQHIVGKEHIVGLLAVHLSPRVEAHYHANVGGATSGYHIWVLEVGFGHIAANGVGCHHAMQRLFVERFHYVHQQASSLAESGKNESATAIVMLHIVVESGKHVAARNGANTVGSGGRSGASEGGLSIIRQV